MSRRSLVVGAFWIATLSFAVSGCGDGGASNGGSEECVEGREASCPCEGGETGIQTCRPDGTWGACDCDDGSSGDALPGMDTGDTGGVADSADSADAGDGGGERDTSDDDSPSALRSVRGTSRFEEDVDLPDCDESNEEVQIIDENSDWSTINGDSRIFCVRPGDYTGAGDLKVTASGSEDARRYLVYDGPSSEHPIDRPGDEQAVVQRLRFDGASYWTVSGITVGDDVDRAITGAVVVAEGSNHNILDRMVVGPHEEDWVDHPLVETFGDHNTVQNSVIGEALNWGSCAPVKAPGRDRVVRGNKVVSNELYNCLDHVQLVVTVPDHSGTSMPGTIVAHNDMYFDENYYTDGNGNFDPDGNWNCGENAVDVKAGSEGDGEPAKIIGNRMWGMSNKDTDCQGAGGTAPSGADAINIHEGEDKPTVGVVARNNIIWDTPSGIGVAHSEDVTIENNLMHTVGEIDGHKRPAYVGLFSDNVTYTNNTVVDGAPKWASFWDSIGGTFASNVVVQGGVDRSDNHSLSTDQNAYYDTEPLESDPWIEEENASAAQLSEFCVTIKGYTAPEEKCFDRAVPTGDSPHGTDVGFTPP